MQLPNTFYFPYELRECKGYGIWNFDKGYFSSKTFPSFRSAKLNNLRFITHTHRRGRLTFNQGESWSQFSLYPAPPVPPALRPCHALPATGALIGFSLLRPQNKKEKWLEKQKNEKRKEGKTRERRIAIFDRRLSLWFRFAFCALPPHPFFGSYTIPAELRTVIPR